MTKLSVPIVAAVLACACMSKSGSVTPQPLAPSAIAVQPTSQPPPQPPITTLPPDGPLPACTNRSDVRAEFLRDECVEFTNLSKTCTAKVGLASFFDPQFDIHKQQVWDSAEKELAVSGTQGQDAVLCVRLPIYTECGKTWRYQTDATVNLSRRELETSPHKAENLLGYRLRTITNAACPTPPPSTPPPPILCGPDGKIPGTDKWCVPPPACNADGKIPGSDKDCPK